MKQFLLHPDRKDASFTALIYILLGLSLCMFSGSLLLTIVRMAGILMLAYGAWQLYQYFGIRKSTNTQPVLIGVPMALAGLILTIWPKFLVSFFPVVAGVLLILNSVMQIQRALDLRAAGYSNWIVDMVIAVIMLIFGLVLIIKPMGIVNMILKVTGIALLIEGCVILFEIYFNKGAKA